MWKTLNWAATGVFVTTAVLGYVLLGKFTTSQRPLWKIVDNAAQQQRDKGTTIVRAGSTRHLTSSIQIGELTHEFSKRKSASFQFLSQEVIDSVEKFVIFIGYRRSGHSIIASMMDAHPNMIIADAYMLFKRITMEPIETALLQNKTYLFNDLYQKSKRDLNGIRNRSNKGYSLAIDTQWQATFHQSLKVIGEKSGGQTVRAYLRDRDQFQEALQRLQRTIGIPIRVIHVVRNPFDIIATSAIYNLGLHDEYVEGRFNVTALKVEYKDQVSQLLNSSASHFVDIAHGIHEMTTTLGLNMLEIHNTDFVSNPSETMSRICDFLDLPCPEDYLQACNDKAYKSTSKRRNLVLWPADVFRYVQRSIKQLPFLRRYTFDSD